MARYPPLGWFPARAGARFRPPGGDRTSAAGILSGMYAIVRSGGRQHRVAVGETVEVNRLDAPVGGTVRLPALLVVDGEQVTTDRKALDGVTVTGEVVAHGKGPKIDILSYRNKTGHRRRQGHRQQLTSVRVTDITAGPTGS